MAKKAQHHEYEDPEVRIKSASVGFPSPTSNGKVLGMPVGMLCRASGDVTPPSANHRVLMVFVKTTDSSTSLSSDDIVNSPTKWSKIFSPMPQPGQIVPWAVDPPSPSLQATVGSNNKIWVTAKYQQVMTGAVTVEPTPGSSLFTADFVSSCPPPGFVDEEEAQETAAASAPWQSLAKDMSGPTPTHAYRDCSHLHAKNCERSCYDWLNFDGLSVDNPNGNWLHVDTFPLKARTIAVAARKVCWRASSRSHQVIRRPAGLVWDYNNLPSIPSFNQFYFSDLPPYSIVIYQPLSGLVHVVTSQCIEHPDIVSLDPNDHVLVYVNDRPLDYADNVGMFSLSVAILDGATSSGCACQ